MEGGAPSPPRYVETLDTLGGCDTSTGSGLVGAQPSSPHRSASDCSIRNPVNKTPKIQNGDEITIAAMAMIRIGLIIAQRLMSKILSIRLEGLRELRMAPHFRDACEKQRLPTSSSWQSPASAQLVSTQHQSRWSNHSDRRKRNCS